MVDLATKDCEILKLTSQRKGCARRDPAEVERVSG